MIYRPGSKQFRLLALISVLIYLPFATAVDAAAVDAAAVDAAAVDAAAVEAAKATEAGTPPATDTENTADKD